MDQDDFERNLSARGGGANSSFSSESGRKDSFYRRQSMHIFILAKNEMLCCCCVPLGMALHIVAFFDIIAAVFLVIYGIDYQKKFTNSSTKEPKIYIEFYGMITYLCFVSMGLYSVPRTVMYFFTMARTNSF